MNDEIEGTIITESNRGEVTHITCGQSTDGDHREERNNHAFFYPSRRWCSPRSGIASATPGLEGEK